ncbi:hypothetical protein SDC9_175271 [bioreactor metagenome]|uniref:Uncharacterized protein n=1 Tax=bioreactor metagenome TaxID=1076179 RepID=A0A645GLS1_9ZZZZ
MLPRDMVHIAQVNFEFFTHTKHVSILIIKIKIVSIGNILSYNGSAWLKVSYLLKRIVILIINSLNCKFE